MALQPIQQTPVTPSSDVIIARLDAIIQPQPTKSIVDQLWGALGQGTADELNELPKDIYLEIFDDESAHS